MPFLGKVSGDVEDRFIVCFEEHDAWPAVLALAHNEVAGHPGVRKTYDRIVHRFFWPKLGKDVSLYIKPCHVCLLTAKRFLLHLLQPFPAVTYF